MAKAKAKATQLRLAVALPRTTRKKPKAKAKANGKAIAPPPPAWIALCDVPTKHPTNSVNSGDAAVEKDGNLDDRTPSRAQTYVFQKYFSDLPKDIQTKWNDLFASKTPGKQLKKKRNHQRGGEADRRLEEQTGRAAH